MTSWQHRVPLVTWRSFFSKDSGKRRTTSMLVLLGAGLQSNEGHYRLALENAGYHVAAGDSAREHQDSPVVGLVSAENAPAQLKEWRQKFTRVRLVLIGDPTSISDSADLALATAPTLTATA